MIYENHIVYLNQYKKVSEVVGRILNKDPMSPLLTTLQNYLIEQNIFFS